MSTIDTIFENATIYDGSGNEPYQADLGISQDKIESIGQLQQVEGARRIETKGWLLHQGSLICTHTPILQYSP